VTESANITSVEAVSNFRNVLRAQQERSSEILSTYIRELQRVVEWFEHDLVFLWKQELRKRYEQVAAARTTYETCKLRTVAGQRSACYEEKKAYERAKQRLQEGERKAEAVKHWRIAYAQEAEECRGRLGKFQHVLDHDVEKSIALLERTVISLENYLGRSIQPEDSAGDEGEGND
jgi:hypothetical protein